jgi:hypothetical protein
MAGLKIGKMGRLGVNDDQRFVCIRTLIGSYSTVGGKTKLSLP